MTRQFKIYNSRGDMIDLLNNLDFFSVNPEGLGISFDNQYHATNSNFLTEQSKANMNTFVISVLFGAQTRQSYERYDELISLLNSPPLTLEYETTVGKWSRQCQLSELTKTEIKELNVLQENLTLDLISPWYTDQTTESETQEPQDGDGKIYSAMEVAPGADGKFYNLPPTDGYKKGDIWYFHDGQVWPGMNLYNPESVDVAYTNTYFLEGHVMPEIYLVPGRVYTFSARTHMESTTQASSLVSSTMLGYMAKGIYAWDISATSLYSSPDQNDERMSRTFTAPVPPTTVPELTTRIKARYIRYGSPATVAGQVYDIMLNEGPLKPFEPSPFVLLGGKDRGYLIANNDNDTLDVNDWELFTPSARQYPSVFRKAIPEYYQQGDLLEWKQADELTWPGYNCVSRMDTTGQVGGGYKINGLAQSALVVPAYDGTTKILRLTTIAGTGSPNYIAGTYSTNVLPKYLTDTYAARECSVMLRASLTNTTIPWHMRIMWWTAASTTPQVRAVQINPNWNLTKYDFLMPADVTNFVVQIMVMTAGPVGEFIEVKEFSLQEKGYQYQEHPSEYFVAQPGLKNAGNFVSAGKNSNFNFDQWDVYAKPLPQPTIDTVYPLMYDYIYSPESPAIRDLSFSYGYDYTYEGWDDGSNGVFLLQNKSRYLGNTIGSPLEITVMGPCSNPSWQIVVDGKVTQSDGFNLEVPDGYKLVVSSIPQNQRAQLIAPDGTVSNVYQQQRLELTNFVTAPPGDSMLVFLNTPSVSFIFREERVVV